ncbi:MAG: site-specific integrase [Bacteroidetes bacterium]|nr:site-specific integrase [Bacteroidota bacterium]
MIKYNAENERIKRKYFIYLKEAFKKSQSTIDNIRKSLTRYEQFTEYKDFKTFNKKKAIDFKGSFLSSKNKQTGQNLSKSTVLSTVRNLQDFFKWLAYQTGYKTKINILDIDYFNLSEKDTRTAKSKEYKVSPTLEQIKKVIFSMQSETEIEKRNQALIAFTILTGIRDGAIASLKIKHIDIENKFINQNPREVKTKFSKQITTFFFPVGDDITEIFVNWMKYLLEEKFYSLDNPVFPRTKISFDKNSSFISNGVEPIHWSSASQIRDIFKKAFESSGLNYFTPHSFRSTLVLFGEKYCQTPEQFKAWSQNLGHESPLTTFTSYGYIEPYKQGEIIKNLFRKENNKFDANMMKQMIAEEVKKEIQAGLNQSS